MGHLTSIETNPNHWTKRVDWVQDHDQSLLCTSGGRNAQYRLRYTSKTGVVEALGSYHPFHGTSPAEYLATLPTGLSRAQAFEAFKKLISK